MPESATLPRQAKSPSNFPESLPLGISLNDLLTLQLDAHPPLVFCIKCHKSSPQWALDPHYLKKHEDCRASPQLTTLEHEVLPPLVGESRSMFEQDTRRLTSSRGGGEEKFDQGRIDRMNLLNPEQILSGSKGWYGYRVYRFSRLDRVVLESPVEGNATYVLTGDWKKLIYLSKAEIRQYHSTECVRIVHKGDNFSGQLSHAILAR